MSETMKEALVPAIIKKPGALPRPRLGDEIKRACELILGNRRRVTVDNVTDPLRIRQSFTYVIIYERLGYGKVYIKIISIARLRITFNHPRISVLGE